MSLYVGALQLRRCSVPVSTLHSSVFARLASGAFYGTIVPATFYEIIKFNGYSFWLLRYAPCAALRDFSFI
jgi:hypothetical protein